MLDLLFDMNARMDFDFTYRVRWSPSEQVFVASAIEFSHLAASGDTSSAAIDALKVLLADEVTRLRRASARVPEPVVKSARARS